MSVVYLGRIPHGFYEKEIRNYFSQFGIVEAVSLARNKLGKSKHFGFIKFKYDSSAKAAAESMNNYLLYGHLLQCKLVEGSRKVFNSHAPKQRVRELKSADAKNEDEAEVMRKVRRQNIQETNEKMKEKGIDYQYDDSVTVSIEAMLESTLVELEQVKVKVQRTLNK